MGVADAAQLCANCLAAETPLTDEESAFVQRICALIRKGI
jgi:hypothetical protein